VLLAYRCAIAHPRIRSTAIEASEFPERADRVGVHGVPAIAVGGRLAWAGRVSEDVFVGRLVAAATGGPPPGTWSSS
jgi:alkyl hydroperoxide reductase subunit AhpF